MSSSHSPGEGEDEETEELTQPATPSKRGKKKTSNSGKKNNNNNSNQMVRKYCCLCENEKGRPNGFLVQMDSIKRVPKHLEYIIPETNLEFLRKQRQAKNISCNNCWESKIEPLLQNGGIEIAQQETVKEESKKKKSSTPSSSKKGKKGNNSKGSGNNMMLNNSCFSTLQFTPSPLQNNFIQQQQNASSSLQPITPTTTHQILTPNQTIKLNNQMLFNNNNNFINNNNQNNNLVFHNYPTTIPNNNNNMNKPINNIKQEQKGIIPSPSTPSIVVNNFTDNESYVDYYDKSINDRQLFLKRKVFPILSNLCENNEELVSQLIQDLTKDKKFYVREYRLNSMLQPNRNVNGKITKSKIKNYLLQRKAKQIKIENSNSNLNSNSSQNINNFTNNNNGMPIINNMIVPKFPSNTSSFMNVLQPQTSQQSTHSEINSSANNNSINSNIMNTLNNGIVVKQETHDDILGHINLFRGMDNNNFTHDMQNNPTTVIEDYHLSLPPINDNFMTNTNNNSLPNNNANNNNLTGLPHHLPSIQQHSLPNSINIPSTMIGNSTHSNILNGLLMNNNNNSQHQQQHGITNTSNLMSLMLDGTFDENLPHYEFQ
ncbi:hypothetical protein ABK040_008162 [Willaertia magna]